MSETREQAWQEFLSKPTYVSLQETFNAGFDAGASGNAGLTDDLKNGQHDVTETRWQNAIYDLCKKLVGPNEEHFIDGGGCDSGDALDVTLTEIKQAVGILSERGASDREQLIQALRALVNLTDQGREGGLILSRADQKGMTNGDQDIIDRSGLLQHRLRWLERRLLSLRAYIAAQDALAKHAPPRRLEGGKVDGRLR